MSVMLPEPPGAGGLPPELAALLGGASGAAPPDALSSGLGQPPPEQPDPLTALQDAIHSVQNAMVALNDPQDTQDAAQALVQLAKIQTRVMGAAGAPQAR